jgi:hypothetical protein
MQGNDIAGFFSPRILVHADVVMDQVDKTRKVLGVFTRHAETSVPNNVAMNRLWHFSSRVNVLLELISEEPQKVIDNLMTEMDERGSNPFRYATGGIFIPALVRDLAYRPDVRGVIDLPQRALMYGSHYLDITQVGY